MLSKCHLELRLESPFPFHMATAGSGMLYPAGRVIEEAGIAGSAPQVLGHYCLASLVTGELCHPKPRAASLGPPSLQSQGWLWGWETIQAWRA